MALTSHRSHMRMQTTKMSTNSVCSSRFGTKRYAVLVDLRVDATTSVVDSTAGPVDHVRESYRDYPKPGRAQGVAAFCTTPPFGVSYSYIQIRSGKLKLFTYFAKV